MMTVGSLFSGIGGIDLGLQRAGMEIKWQCEKDPWCRKILTKHWPELPKYEDITTLQPEAVEYVDVLAGGFPCQDLSVAGKRAGLRTGTRSGLWLEFARLIRGIRPQYVLVENVPGLLANHALGRVLGDLADCGYDAEWKSYFAWDFGYPHHRKRVFLVAYPRSHSTQKNKTKVILVDKTRRSPCVGESGGMACSEFWGQIIRRFSGNYDGIPFAVDRLRGLGNAVLPDIITFIGKQIVTVAKGTT